ncbi:helicase associated domain-containing protein [Streptomyces sp. NPDC088348]|uniref:helicase associated domain-containing protein n=1 Tax=Streptomyces sp. NPDC088348 TaxID=3365853 RepID=UPI00380CF9BE
MYAFHRGLRAARQFHQREGELLVSLAHREDLQGDEVLLGRWIKKCRTQTARLTASQITAVTALGIELDPLFLPPPPTSTDQPADDDPWWAPSEDRGVTPGIARWPQPRSWPQP